VSATSEKLAAKAVNTLVAVIARAATVEISFFEILVHSQILPLKNFLKGLLFDNPAPPFHYGSEL
jgi:hypothetical protein